MLYSKDHMPLKPESIPGKNISLVGAGGKSTIMYFLARYHADLGRKVLVTTSTKIYRPANCCYCTSAEEVRANWDRHRFAVIGTPIGNGEKLAKPNEELYQQLRAEADLVLIEADGAKRNPIKTPRANEPDIRSETDTVLCVMGLSALGQPMGSCCFGWQDPEDPQPLTEELAAQILCDDQRGRKGVGNRKFYILLNQWDRPELGSRIPDCATETVLFSHFSPEDREYYQQIARGTST